MLRPSIARLFVLVLAVVLAACATSSDVAWFGPRKAQDAPAASADGHAWRWIHATPSADGWALDEGTADATLDGSHFEATLYDASGEVVARLTGTTDGATVSRVTWSSAAGEVQHGKGRPRFEGTLVAPMPQVLGHPAQPPKPIRQSVTLLAGDEFLGLVRR